MSRTPEQAWDALCEALRRTGRAALDWPAPNGALDRAEAFRYLAGLAVSGLRQAIELSDPERPRFVRNPDSAAPRTRTTSTCGRASTRRAATGSAAFAAAPSTSWSR